MEAVQTTLEWLAGSLGSAQGRVVATVLIIAVSWLVQIFATRLVNRGVQDPMTRYQLRKGVTYGLVFVAALAVGALWLPTVRSLATYFGLLSAGLAIALRDVIQNAAGWLFVIWRRPFVVGERVEIGEFAGDVIDIRVLRFTLLEIGNWVDADQTTGRIVHVPSGYALTKPVLNYDRGLRYIWNEIPVAVSRGSDWRRAKELLLSIIEQYASRPTTEDEQKLSRSKERYLIVDETLDPQVFTRVVDGDLQLTARYLCDPRRRRRTANDIWEHLIDAVASEPNVEFAYPTQSIDLSTPGDEPPSPR